MYYLVIMFGLFKNKPAGIPVVDKVWMSRNAKYNACAGMLAVNAACLFVCWFKDTREELRVALNLPEDSDSIQLAENITPDQARDRMVVLVEHHPLATIEQAFFAKAGLREAPVLSSLDEPFFMTFGGERTVELMKKLGMKEDEVVGNSMVTRAIFRAQEKVAAKFISNHYAQSQGEWLKRNLNRSA